MKLLLNDNQEIIAYATLGDLNASIEYTGTMPVDFEDSFKPNFYLFKDGEIVVNEDYQDPVITDPGPSESQQQLAQVTYQQMMTAHYVTTLQTQNAQMAYQLMMMQKQGGEA